MIYQHGADNQRRRNHKPYHTHKALNEKIVFRSDLDTSQIEVHICIDNTWNPHHNDGNQQYQKDFRPTDFFEFYSDQ